MQGPLRRPTGSLHLYVRVFRAFRGYLSLFGATRRRSRVRCVARTRRFHRQLSPATDDIDLFLTLAKKGRPLFQPQRNTKDTKENQCLLCVSPILGCPHTILWPTNRDSPFSPFRQTPSHQRLKAAELHIKVFLCALRVPLWLITRIPITKWSRRPALAHPYPAWAAGALS